MSEVVEAFLREKGLVNEFEEFKINFAKNAPNIKLSGRLMYGDADGWHIMQDCVFTKEDWAKIVKWAEAYCKQFDAEKGVVPFGSFEGTSGALTIGDLIGRNTFNEIYTVSTHEETKSVDWDTPVEILQELIDKDTGECYWRHGTISKEAEEYLDDTPFYSFTFIIYAAYYYKTGKLVEMPDADWV